MFRLLEQTCQDLMILHILGDPLYPFHNRVSVDLFLASPGVFVIINSQT